jgi:hypothetical protein
MSGQDPSATTLPEESDITRRDFVGGTVVGSGAALLAMAQEVVRDNEIKIESVYTYVRGNAGWDWTYFNVMPTDGKTKPFSFAILFLWSKIDGVWCCKGNSFVRGSFRSGKLAPPEAPAKVTS